MQVNTAGLDCSAILSKGKKRFLNLNKDLFREFPKPLSLQFES